MIFPSFLVLEPDLEPRNLPPCRKLSDLLCSSLCCPSAALVCGGKLLGFLLAAGLLSPAMSGFCSCKLCFRTMIKH
ncbi:hypothetical protein SLEP1_g22153 [Rubroshorea leprosula]|uniref:Uncharacterized protein n=1 Tax=Rubroshorea leprosula TaxID=152421 RepID=A0AAV5JBD6_9ROSI|nr:hypothetical protein SLEP1_g22153 [Rubroshorea leprosula]